MTASEVAEKVVRALRTAEIPFLVVGSFSSNQYGIPRSTKDIDLVVAMGDGQSHDLSDILGSEFTPEAQLRFETNTGTMCQEFSVKDSTMKVEVFSLSDDPHDQERFRRKIERSMFGIAVPFATAEDVIIWKLRWGRAKDLEDVRGVILVQREEGRLDWEYVRFWCDRHGTSKVLEELLASLPGKNEA